MNWFEIPENLVPKLRELQKNDFNHDIVRTQDAVIMFGGMGDPMYLALDGRVIIDECFMENKGPREAATLTEAAMAVVIGAKTRNLPELLLILPARSENAVDCVNCETTGWFKPGGVLGSFVCGDCGGLGWKQT